MKYEHQSIEEKWQARWEREQVFCARDLPPKEKPKKFYGLIEFPYPSGEGLHVGHPRSYVALDIITRKKRMEGRDVLYPIGWDAFGLPTENFAIKNKVRPAEATKKNVANFKRQLKMLGLGFDWSREINTTDPGYYKWTQWMFLKFFGSFYDAAAGRARPIEELPIPEAVSARGEAAVREYRDSNRLAYKARARINWCPRCKIGLANEEAAGGVCERCGEQVEERAKEQWLLRITKYAERLIADLETVDYLERIKTQQKNWIGRSEGAYVDFQITRAGESLPDKVTVFTTRPDTLFGATYLVLAPEHPLIATWIKEGWVKNSNEVIAYQDSIRGKSELERQESREKTGVELSGVKAINPANDEEMPVWIADYVLSSYGTGSIMAVPAHDERDFEFAEQFGLKIVTVVAPTDAGDESRCFSGDGRAVNSDFLNGLPTSEAKEKIIANLEERGAGERTVNYKLRDWVFSRQRYWGEPIPIVNCKNCGQVPVLEKDLPVALPEVEHYEPTDTGESPLAAIRDWVLTACPACGASAERETDTMPNWAGSSWYFLRYADPKNDRVFADPNKLRFWLPVDLYNGGMEHTTLHLLYSRFWYKCLWDLKVVPEECGSEPYRRRRSHALILGEGGVKMSKSKGNVVNPDQVVALYGADVFRTYMMFIGPFDQDAPWDTNGIVGVRRFLERVYEIGKRAAKEETEDSPEVTRLLHQTVKKVSEDIEVMRFNTAVSALMIFSNALAERGASKNTFATFLKILSPFAPHLSEECFEALGNDKLIATESWPEYDPSLAVATEITVAVQINGRLRETIKLPTGATEDEARAAAESSAGVKKYLSGKKIARVVYVPDRLLNYVIE
jgi:leucyl-tRNA synthetase